MASNVTRSRTASTRESTLPNNDNDNDISMDSDISNATRLFQNALEEKIDALNLELNEAKMNVTSLRRELAESKGEIGDLKNEIQRMQIDTDDLQQYGRRQNVRLEGIEWSKGESEEELYQLIKTNLAKVEVDIKKSQLVRFHRSSRPSTSERSGKVCAQVLVKFQRWEQRRACHFANKKARDGNINLRVNHDLTKRKYQLLGRARQLIADKFP